MFPGSIKKAQHLAEMGLKYIQWKHRAKAVTRNVL